MPQSLAKVLVHIVYSAKGRRPWLKDEDLRRQPYAYKATILRDNVDSPALIVGGAEDHIHALCLLSRKFAIKDVIEKAKTETTTWLKKQGLGLPLVPQNGCRAYDLLTSSFNDGDISWTMRLTVVAFTVECLRRLNRRMDRKTVLPSKPARRHAIEFW